MKRTLFYIFPLLILIGFLGACAGTAPRAVDPPENLKTGLREIQKGNALYARGCYRRAASHFFKAHAEFTAADDQPGVAVSLNSIGNIYQADGDPENALAFFNEALGIYSETGDLQARLQTLSNKAAALIDADRLKAAEALIAETEKSTATPFLPLAINKGILLIKQKTYARAQSILENALARTGKKDLASRARIHFALGRLMSVTDNPSGAGLHFSKALEHDRAVGFYAGMARTLVHLGDTWLTQKAPDRALHFYKRAAKLYALIGDRPNAGRLMDKLDNLTGSNKADIRITTHFVKTWLDDKSFEGPCR